MHNVERMCSDKLDYLCKKRDGSSIIAELILKSASRIGYQTWLPQAEKIIPIISTFENSL